MKGDQVPKSNHVSRYCGGSHVQNGQVDGSAFMLRETDDYLSVNWLEHLAKGDRGRQIRNLRHTLEAKGLRLGKSALLAVLKVGEAIDHVQEAVERILDVLHEPESDDHSHSGIFGYNAEDDIIADLLAETVNETYPARER